VFGVRHGLDKTVVSGDASAVVRRTCEAAIDAYRVLFIRIRRELFLQDDAMFPVIAEIVRVDNLGARSPQHVGEFNGALVLYIGHPYA
jgi:hypothetical protein